METNVPAALWSPLDIAAYWRNTRLVAPNGEPLNYKALWSILTSEKEADLRSNSLDSSYKAFDGYCDGCYSVS